MKELIKAVRAAVKQDNLYSALFIALTLPDICGRIEKPSTGSKERYIDWFGRYLESKYIDHFHHQVAFLTGEDMYAFRCSLLHEGVDDITAQKAQKVINRFILISEGPHLNYFEDQSVKLQISVKQFCAEICEAVEHWLTDIKDNPDFIDYEKKMIKILPKGSVVNGIQFG